MTGRWRAARLSVVVAIGATALAGCGERESKIDEVRAAIRATRREATQFIYTDARTDVERTVTGVAQDDFRFKTLVAYDGAPGFEEIVLDDALAMRVHDPERLAELVDRDRIDSADLTTEIEGANVLQALNSKRWVLDETGAPPVTTFGNTSQELGKDPVFDALTALDYVDTALSQAVVVDEWREDALNPTYPRSEDVFPKPEQGSGVTRYDLRRGRLPPLTQGGAAGGRQALPATAHFRKMAIYVEDGRIIRVLERVEVIGKFVNDLEEYLKTFVEEAGIGGGLESEFKSITRTARGAEAGRRYLEFLNKALVGLGGEPVLARTMSLEFESEGDAVTVALPDTDVVKGSLEVMLASRAAKSEETTTGEEPAPEPGEQQEPIDLTPTTAAVPGAPAVPGGETPTTGAPAATGPPG